MSVDVLREVFRLSQSKGVARNVLTVLADAAHPDGVTWLPIEPSKGGDPARCLTHRANASRRAVIDAIASLEEAGEIEVRQAQRERRRINVYRVVLGQVAAVAVDYTDLPFDLERPFGDGVQNLHVVTNTESGDGVQISSRRGADFVKDTPVESSAFAGDFDRSRLPEASSKASSPSNDGEGRRHSAPPPASIEHVLDERFGQVAPRTNAGGRRRKAVADLRALGATADSIRHAVTRWPFVFPGATLTDIAIATHFPQLTVGYAPPAVPGEREAVTASQRRWVVEQARDPAVSLVDIFCEIGLWHLGHIEAGELIEFAERERAALEESDHPNDEEAAA